jgi:hypothetical protein
MRIYENNKFQKCLLLVSSKTVLCTYQNTKYICVCVCVYETVILPVVLYRYETCDTT